MPDQRWGDERAYRTVAEGEIDVLQDHDVTVVFRCGWLVCYELMEYGEESGSPKYAALRVCGILLYFRAPM